MHQLELVLRLLRLHALFLTARGLDFWETTVAKVRHFRKSKRLRTIERLCERSLFAADLDFHAIPKEPDSLVEWDRDYYANLNLAAHPPQAPLADTFFLHSRPTATKTIYLDFDGNITRGTSWNSANNVATIISPAYDPDGNGAAFTNNELARIQDIWKRVAADFAPFDVNVTTQDPGEAALVNTGGTDTRWGIRVVMTVDNFANSGAGGFAYINSFNWNYESVGATDTPCFVFNTSGVGVSGAISHEVGHSLGLSHDGTTSAHPSQPSAAYYDGHGTGETSWGPIMGSGYYSNVTTWDTGEYFGTNNAVAGANYGRGPDDISIMTTFNGFGFVPDDHGDTTSSATTINYIGANLANPNLIDVSLFGTVQTRSDLDYIRFETGTGNINLTIDPYITQLWTANSSGTYDRSIENSFFGTSWANNQGANLDVEAKLYDASGALVATSNPAGLRASFTNLNLPAGTYFISIDGVGFANPASNPPVGYSDYGSLGQYLITGTITSLGVDLDLGAGSATYIENGAPVPISPAATFRDSFGVNYDLLTMSASIVSNGETADRLAIISTGTGSGQISTSGNQVRFGGTVFGTFVQSAGRLTVDLDSNATRGAVEALVRSIGYSSVSDGPNPLARRVEVAFGLGVAKTRDVQVVPTNDSPSISNTSLPLIDEDVPTPIGTPIDLLLAGSFSDPDPGSQMSGIAIVENQADRLSEGTWYYSSDQGGSWTAIGTVNDTSASLVVDATTWIGFLPVANYFGTPSPLKVRVLDNTFAGSFSNSVGDQRRFLSSATRGTTDGPVSPNPGSIGVTVRNINDAPVANYPSVQVPAVQDRPLNFKMDDQFPGGLFSDIDSPSLTWSLIPIGLPEIPTWLTFDPVRHTLSGVPANADVGNYEFRLRANDGFASVAIPLSLVVANVNDAPEILGLNGQVVWENDVAARIGLVTAFDPDLNDVLTYAVSDNRFTVNEGILSLKPLMFIDFEREPVVNLTVTATDNGSPTLATSQAFTITVRDRNEFFPTFASQDLQIPHNRSNNQLLGTVQAIDQDTQQTVKYNIQQDDAGIFQIDTNSGEVRLKSGAQVTEKSYRLFIGAYDNGTPSNSRVVLFNVAVEIPNQFAPVLASGRNLSVPENALARTSVGKVTASDADGDTNLRYTTTSRQFTIDSVTGIISVADGTLLNYEVQSSYVVMVDVTDSGTPARTSSHAITVSVQNVNDPPTAITLVDNKVPALQKGIALSQFVVSDEDPAASYVFTTSDNRFEIRSGRLAHRQNAFFAQSLAGTTTTVNVTVTDAADTTSSATLPLAVDITSNPFPWQNRKTAADVNNDGLGFGTRRVASDQLVELVDNW